MEDESSDDYRFWEFPDIRENEVFISVGGYTTVLPKNFFTVSLAHFLLLCAITGIVAGGIRQLFLGIVGRVDVVFDVVYRGLVFTSEVAVDEQTGTLLGNVNRFLEILISLLKILLFVLILLGFLEITVPGVTVPDPGSLPMGLLSDAPLPFDT